MHVAIIMDGNGRWAELRGLPRTLGHHAGAKAAKRIIEAAAKLPIDVLTLYVFSCDNWSRPAAEIHGIFTLMKRYLQSESTRCADNGIEVQFIGRRDRFADELQELIAHVERVTHGGHSLQLRIAADYSSRRQILEVARHAGTSDFESNRFASAMHGDVDMLIRTGGERRLSDFLLWECAYAELMFVDTYWPDFGEHALRRALTQYERRERRYGGLGEKTQPVVRA